jgi:purine-binding chemotaxis protein CheW
MEHQNVVFKLANEFYGVDIAAVQGIIKLQPITAVPRAPACVEGVTNLRGKVLPVLDLHKRFGLPAEAATADSRIVVVELGEATVGLIVDAVSDVLRFSSEVVEPPSPVVTTVHSRFIHGIAKVAPRLIILLDLGQVLTLSEQTRLQALPEAA